MAANALTPKNRRHAWQKRWYLLWPVTLALMLYPINDFWTRTGLLASLAMLWGGVLFFDWHKRIIRFPLLFCTGAAACFLILPGRADDVSKLRSSYVTSLGNYEGTTYIWGGENRLGIDCSGLVRKGLIMADYRRGISTLNPALLREGFSLWWHDCSAQALGEEYRHGTRLLFDAPSINELDHSRILPGDIAVTRNGVHTLAYIGSQTWIEADPTVRRVIKVQVPTKNAWFGEPVNILRCTQLEEK
jgi:hypothetical protein